MNKGIIYKVKIDDDFHYYIRLEKTEKIGDTEYNIFIGEPNGSVAKAELVSVEVGYTLGKDLTSLLGKKLNFGIDCDNKKLTSVEYEA